MKRLAIVGGGDLGQLIAWHAASDGQFEVAGFFDDFATPGSTIDSHVVLGPIAHLRDAFRAGQFDELIVAVGYKHPVFRAELMERFGELPWATLIHSSSYVDRSCRVGRSVVVLPGCVVDRNTVISDNVLLNVGCVVAHDSLIGSHSFLGPAVKIAGFVTLGERSFLGIGTTIIDNISIAPGTRTGGGTVVTEDTPQAGLYVGIPARFVRP